MKEYLKKKKKKKKEEISIVEKHNLVRDDVFDAVVATLARFSKPLALRVHADPTKKKRHSGLRSNWLE